MDTSGNAQAVELFQKLEGEVTRLKLQDEPFAEPAIIDGVTILNARQLMQELLRLNRTLSEIDFLPYYRAGAAIISDVANEAISKWVEILETYEEAGNASRAFQLFKGTPEYDREFVVFKRGRDWSASNRRQVELGLETIPQEWPTIGRTLLAVEDRHTESYVRQLKAMCGQIKSETTAIHRINRAILVRLDSDKTRNKSLTPNYADIRAAKALPISFQVPLETEVRERGLYFDKIGLVTKNAPERQSYAQTEAGTPTPARTSKDLHAGNEGVEEADHQKTAEDDLAGHDDGPSEHEELEPGNQADEELEGGPGDQADEELEGGPGDQADEELEGGPGDQADEELEGRRNDDGDSQDDGEQIEVPGPQPFLAQAPTPILRLPKSNEQWDFLVKDLMKNVKGIDTDPRETLKRDGLVDLPVFDYLTEGSKLHQAAVKEIDRITVLTKKSGATHWACQFAIIQQILQQDLLLFFINACVRPDHPVKASIFPQPSINTSGSVDLTEPFSVSVALKGDPEIFENSLLALVPLHTEDENTCDQLFTGKGGPIESLTRLKMDYETHLGASGQRIIAATRKTFDAEGMIQTFPDTYQSLPSPLPKPGNVRLMPPWVPRAHIGKEARCVLTPTLVATRQKRAIEPCFDLLIAGHGPLDPTGKCSESGLRVSDIGKMHQSQSTHFFGPWGTYDKDRRLEPWSLWTRVQGLNPISDALLGLRSWDDFTVISQLNILFSTNKKKTHKRWDLIKSHRRLLTAFAEDAIERFLANTNQSVPASGNKRPNKTDGSAREGKRARTG